MNTEEARKLAEHLRNGQQCDDDGVMCIVSRQACHEAAAVLTAALDEIERLRGVLEEIDMRALQYDAVDMADMARAALEATP